MKISRPAWFALVVMLLIVLVWTAAYPLARTLPQATFPESFEKVYNGLNVLFTALAFGGVIVTLLFQAEESRIARREEVERSIFELFQVFTSADFQRVKDGAFRTLIASVQDRDYGMFLTGRLFVATDEVFPASSVPVLQQLDINKLTKSPREVEDLDRADRLMLDNVLNFFAMLVQRKSYTTVIHHCDFAYDWWRPMLWLVGQLQRERYAGTSEIQAYCRTPLIITTLEKLDHAYGHTGFNNDHAVWEYLANHPKVKRFKLDARYLEPHGILEGQAAA
jgi:uncharacterized membrane protein YhdT